MSRTIEFNPDEKCDQCGAKGAFDFYGDTYCPACIESLKKRPEREFFKNLGSLVLWSVALGLILFGLTMCPAKAESSTCTEKDCSASVAIKIIVIVPEQISTATHEVTNFPLVSSEDGTVASP